MSASWKTGRRMASTAIVTLHWAPLPHTTVSHTSLWHREEAGRGAVQGCGSARAARPATPRGPAAVQPGGGATHKGRPPCARSSGYAPGGRVALTALLHCRGISSKMPRQALGQVVALTAAERARAVLHASSSSPWSENQSGHGEGGGGPVHGPAQQRAPPPCAGASDSGGAGGARRRGWARPPIARGGFGPAQRNERAAAGGCTGRGRQLHRARSPSSSSRSGPPSAAGVQASTTRRAAAVEAMKN